MARPHGFDLWGIGALDAEREGAQRKVEPLAESTRPGRNRLICRRLPSNWRTPGGLFLPEYLPDEERDIQGLANQTREYWLAVTE